MPIALINRGHDRSREGGRRISERILKREDVGRRWFARRLVGLTLFLAIGLLTGLFGIGLANLRAAMYQYLDFSKV